MERDKTPTKVDSRPVDEECRAGSGSQHQTPGLEVTDSDHEHAHHSKPAAATATVTSGVSRVEAFNRMLAETGKGKILLWTLGISLLLTMFAYALDQGITSQFTLVAASSLNKHAQIGSLLSTPFLITVPLDGFISDGFVPNHWRWGLGMFAIMVPALLMPAIVTLFTIQHKAAKHNMVSIGDSGFTRKGELEKMGKKPTLLQLFWQGIIDIDLMGLILLGFAFALILLPLNLARSSTTGWENPSYIAMIVMDFVILIGFILWESLIAPKPIVTKKLLTNKTFMCAIGIDICIQLASGLRATYFSSYICIIKDWSNYTWTIFLGATTLGLCFIAPVGGLIHRLTHRYKTLQMVGAAISLMCNGLLLNGHRATQSTARLVASQVLFGFGSFVVIGTRVASQASVPHEDVATLISSLALWSTLGSSVGASISASIWSNTMLGYMREECPPGTPETTLRKIYASITVLHQREWTDPIRQGGIRAYTRVLGWIFIISTIIVAIELCLTFFMPNYYLGKQQNAVTNTGLDGKPIELRSDEQSEEPKGLMARIKRIYYKQS
ncbi:hypothetical protein PRZ48_012632 [Zasmidium cellare]|uniref:Uncharacterized protein n=1 Tax=Zasmidium cellare TaxID=395010 RepID=A0ABR0E5K7_ZASCE|nr:hypothetical protein PRZ48_012632 [Zasmidium cellare]